MSSEHNTVERTDAALRYYRQLRDAVLQAGREPGLRDHRFVAGVESVMTNLARLIFEKQSLQDLDDVRKLDPELRDAAILFLINRLQEAGSGATLRWYSDRLEEFGGSQRVLSDPQIRTPSDVVDRLSDFEPWHA